MQLFRTLEAKLNKLMARMILPCADITRMLSESMDRTLPLGQRQRIRLHLAICRYCRRYDRQLRFIGHVADGLDEHIVEQLPAAAKERLKEALCKVK